MPTPTPTLLRASVVTATVLSLAVTGCGSSDPAAPPTTDVAPAAGETPATAQLLFVVRGEGSLTGDTLTVRTGPAARATWISDRPHRFAGQIGVPDLVAGWEAYGFVDDPPNAVLTNGTASTSVELRDPRWDAATGSLTIGLTSLDHAVLPVGDLGAVELFVDSSTAICVGQLTPAIPAAFTLVGAEAGLSCDSLVQPFLEALDSAIPNLDFYTSDTQLNFAFSTSTFGWSCSVSGSGGSCIGVPDDVLAGGPPAAGAWSVPPGLNATPVSLMVSFG